MSNALTREIIQKKFSSFLSSCAACLRPFYAGCRITQAHDREYHYECFRCERCSQPIDGTFTVSPDGSKFQVSRS